MTRPNSITKGDRVAFSRSFLRSIQAYTGWHPFARGVVLHVLDMSGLSLVTVHWDDGEQTRANACNLVREDRIHLEPV